MNNIGSNVNHTLKNIIYFLSIKLITFFTVRRCPISGTWPAHRANHPFYGWKSQVQHHPLVLLLLAATTKEVDQRLTDMAEIPPYNQPAG